MRTTLVIAEDVHRAAVELAKESGKSLGDVVSELARNGLRRQVEPGMVRNGIRLLRQESSGPTITSEMVRSLLHESEEQS